MKILVDKMPSDPRECMFSETVFVARNGGYEDDFNCKLNKNRCNVSNCRYLKEDNKANDRNVNNDPGGRTDIRG